MRGPIRTRRSSPVFVVETSVCFRVSAECRMVIVGLGPSSSMSSPPQGGVEGERPQGAGVAPGHQAMNETESEGHVGEGVHDRLRPPIGYPQNI
jgi:hypothetical protein